MIEGNEEPWANFECDQCHKMMYDFIRLSKDGDEEDDKIYICLICLTVAHNLCKESYRKRVDSMK